ncbi:hypothetical protein [Streptomyces sp. NPDC046887]|uniref:hypothetical protein n=1 Tax=Streptomyces sp. NPDC046887 TaxID=3155472 RepID=UPI0033E5B862
MPVHPQRPPSSSPSAPGAEPGPVRAAGLVVRWAAFGCALVAVGAVVAGTSSGGAVAAALGLVAVTGACRRVLLRRAERSGPGDEG